MSTEFSRQEYWSGLPFLSPEDLPDPGIESGSPELQADSSLFELQARPMDNLIGILLNLYIALDNMATLTIFILPI